MLADSLFPLYLQLHSLRREVAVDAEGTVRQVRALGFAGVEIISDYGWTVSRWRRVLAECNLRVVAAHTNLETLESGLGSLDFYRALDTWQLVVTALPRARQSAERYREGARRLDAAARRLALEGFSLAYHHHDFEFQWSDSVDGRTGLDLLLEETDPALVGFEFDTFWLARAGQDPVEFIRRHAARTRLIHAKDLRRTSQKDVPAGQGEVDFRTLLPLCAEHGWSVVLEYEGEDAIVSVREGARHLHALLEECRKNFCLPEGK